MGHQDQDGEKVGQMSLFFKSQRLLRTEKIKNSYTFKSYYLLLVRGVSKIRMLTKKTLKKWLKMTHQMEDRTSIVQYLSPS